MHHMTAPPQTTSQSTSDANVDGGSATVEFALILPTVVALVGVVLGSVAWAQAAVLAQDAASTAARVAVTNSNVEAVTAAHRIAGDGAQVVVTREAGWIYVTVTLPAHGMIPETTTRATARAQP